MKNDLSRLDIFKLYAEDILKEYPELKYHWEIDTDMVELSFPKSNDDGFDICMQVSNNRIVISTDKLVDYLHNFKDDYKEVFENYLGVVRDLLSPNMRIKEFLSNNSSYKWQIQYLENGEWITENNAALIFWNYFGKRSYKYYTNYHLEPRETIINDN